MLKWFEKSDIKKIRALLEDRENLPIIILTGSGISAESGIQTFRGKDGLWQGSRIEEVCRPEGFESNPKKVIDFYNERRKEILKSEVKPNLAHLALARLEQELIDVYVITQNVDDLHERADSKNVFHMHGSLLKNKCNTCLHVVESKEPMAFPNQCHVCGEENQLRPDVVFFKEFPYHMREIEKLVNSAKIFISIGTSGLVYPAAGLVKNAQHNGAICIEINPNASGNTQLFDLSIKRNAGDCLPEICEELISIIKDGK